MRTIEYFFWGTAIWISVAPNPNTSNCFFVPQLKYVFVQLLNNGGHVTFNGSIFRLFAPSVFHNFQHYIILFLTTTTYIGACLLSGFGAANVVDAKK